MPGEDRKGPMGKGPRTGRRLGRCNDPRSDAIPSDDQQTTDNGLISRPGRGLGRGLRRCRGRGRGFGRD